MAATMRAARNLTCGRRPSARRDVFMISLRRPRRRVSLAAPRASMANANANASGNGVEKRQRTPLVDLLTQLGGHASATGGGGEEEEEIWENVIVESLSNDSRHIGDNCVYFCIEGTKLDGHDFASQAAENGAVAIVASKPVDLGAAQQGEHNTCPVILVENTQQSLAMASKSFYGK